MRRFFLASAGTALLLTLSLGGSAVASAVKSGNIIVAYGTNLSEYTPTGQLVQTFTPANAPDGYNTWEGVSVSNDGKLHILNQQFNNYLTNYNPADNSTVTSTMSGMNIAGVTYYGNIASDANYTYVPDISTDIGDPQGIIRFSSSNPATSQRFATSVNPHAVAVGLNDKIYAVDGSTNVSEWDPVTLTQIKAYNLVQVTGSTQYAIEDIAVAANGDLYTLNSNSQVYHYDANGNQLSINQVPNAATSIKLAANGKVVFGSTGNRVTLSNISDLTVTTTFTFSGSGTVFTAFAIPEPTSLGLLTPCAATLLLLRRRPLSAHV